jgi:hypothetical protein
MLRGAGHDVGDELHEGLPQAPIYVLQEGQEAVATRSVSMGMGRLLQDESS